MPVQDYPFLYARYSNPILLCQTFYALLPCKILLDYFYLELNLIFPL